VPCHHHNAGSDGDNGDDDEDDNDSDDQDADDSSAVASWLRGGDTNARFNLYLIRADSAERHAAYHQVDRLTALLSLLAEDVEREISRGAQYSALEVACLPSNWAERRDVEKQERGDHMYAIAHSRIPVTPHQQQQIQPCLIAKETRISQVAGCSFPATACISVDHKNLFFFSLF
jgi:hypothetical protein